MRKLIKSQCGIHFQREGKPRLFHGENDGEKTLGTESEIAKGAIGPEGFPERGIHPLSPCPGSQNRRFRFRTISVFRKNHFNSVVPAFFKNLG